MKEGGAPLLVGLHGELTLAGAHVRSTTDGPCEHIIGVDSWWQSICIRRHSVIVRTTTGVIWWKCVRDRQRCDRLSAVMAWAADARCRSSARVHLAQRIGPATAFQLRTG